jgi:putative MATE family efflux protein
MEEETKTGESDLDHSEIRGMFEGPILKLLVRLTLPIFFGMVFQILYNIVDTIWISRIDLKDPSYVGGVGIVFPILFLVIAFASGLMIGVSSLVARSIGERNKYVLNRTAESGLIVGFILAALFLVFGYIFDDRLLRLLGAHGDYFIHGLEYLQFLLPAGALMIIVHVFAGILMGEGLMKQVMVAMIFSTLTNIVLDPIFIFPLGMGVRGAGLATAIAQIVPLIYVIILYRKKKTVVQIEWKLRNLDPGIMKQIIAVGFPQSAGMITMSISFLFFNRLVMGIDPLALTAFSICGRFDYIMIVPILSIGSAMLTMIGQNFGRQQYKRMFDIWKVGLFTMLSVMAFLATLLVTIAPKIYPFFSQVDQVVRYSVLQTRTVEYSFLLAGIALLSRSCFQAIGRAMPGMIITIIRIIGIALPMAYFYVNVLDLGMYGVWFGLITGNLVGSILALSWVKKTFGTYIIKEESERPSTVVLEKDLAVD